MTPDLSSPRLWEQQTDVWRPKLMFCFVCVCVCVCVLQQQRGKQDSCALSSWQLPVLRVQTCRVRLKFPHVSSFFQLQMGTIC